VTDSEQASENDSKPDSAWNYFNYFTEVEEQFQKARGTGLFLMSPMDWALVESWKNEGVPLPAVLRGIEEAFRKGAKRRKFQNINSIAYCAQAVAKEAELMMNNIIERKPEVEAPFTLDELIEYFEGNLKRLRELGEPYRDVTAALEKLRADLAVHYSDLEELEQRLTALEEKMSAIAKVSQSEEKLFELRRDLEAELRPYRGKMTTSQLAMLERNYLEQRILEQAQLPRLSLFYLR
jgi:DNA repair exonuclease SbcCD ATPase subunit